MKLFRNTPIRKKLMMIMLITSGIVLLITCTAYFLYEYVTFRRSLLNQTSILGKMCAANSTAALAFENAADAEEVLSTLQVNPHIVAAVLYKADGTVLATYMTHGAVSLPDSVHQDGFLFHEASLHGFIPVERDAKRLGTLYIRSDLDAMYERLQLYGITAFGVVVLALIVAYFLSRSLQRSITGSILALAETAKTISSAKDYSVRATVDDDDEVGLLTRAFNDMLSEIEKQNRQIVSFNEVLEGRIRERTLELETAYGEMEAFSYSVSHDLNAPLRKINTHIDAYLLRHEKNLDEEGKKAFDRITANARKMQQLISDLLAFSQFGKKELVKSDVDMHELVRGIFEEQKRLQDGTRNIQLDLHPMPVASVDVTSIAQVWTNLISNALKYTGPRETTRVEIGCRKEEGRTVYYVRDNGVGFSMEYYDKLFRPFNRLHAARDFEGTGVGLAIIQRIIAKHGGEVWAESELDRGSVFYFSLPD